MTAVNVTGKIKSDATVRRELRRELNFYAGQLSAKVLAKAMTGDSTAMLAATNLLIASSLRNEEPAK